MTVATKSVLKSVRIKDKTSAYRLVNTLEHAEGKRSKVVMHSRTFSDASRDEIRKMFGKS